MIGFPPRQVAYVKRATPVWSGSSWLSGNYTPVKLPAGGGVPFGCYGWSAQSAAEVKAAGGGYTFSSPTLFVELYLPRELHHAITGERIADLDALDLIELPERGPVNEVQKLTALGSPTGGTFTPSIGGVSTAAMPYNLFTTASAAPLTTALQALPGVGANNVRVDRTATHELAVAFLGELAAQPQPLLGVTSALAGGVNPRVEVSRWSAGTRSGDAYGQYLITGYKRDTRGLTGWAPGYVLNLQRTT